MLKLSSKKYTAALLLLLLISVFSLSVSADETKYTIEKYDVNIIVNKDNTFDITENIIANFIQPQHGIIRKIPTKNKVVRNDGTSSSNKVRISDIHIYGDDYSVSDGNYKEIRIGDADTLITGLKEYIISYKYDIGADPLKNKDELYFNIIGTEWDTTISNVSFEIVMPKEFDASTLGFSVGSQGAIGYENINYSVDENTISGVYSKTLMPYEGLTVRLELPEGYFKVSKLKQIKNFIVDNIALIFVSISALITAIKYFVFQIDEKDIVETVEFYPPNNLTAADIKHICKSYYFDTVAMTIELANQGYITIYEEGDDCYLIKNATYDGPDERYKVLMEDLFEDSDEVNIKKHKLKPTSTLKRINEITEEKNSYIFKNSSTSSQNIASASFFIGMPIILFFGRSNSLIAVISMFIYILMIPIKIKIKTNQKTEEGKKLYGRVLGFKNFIETAEKERIEMLVDDNPKYFYNILPYAYILGVTDKWIKKFESIGIAEPDWYNGNSFDALMLTSDLNNNFGRSYSSNSSGGGSGSSGGGSSGGGSGGGGGSSW